jgi:hypothetical protein
MKDLKHIKRFNESEENFNISDVSDSIFDNMLSKEWFNKCKYLSEDDKKELINLYNKFNKQFNNVKLSLPSDCRNNNECSSFCVKVGLKKHTIIQPQGQLYLVRFSNSWLKDVNAPDRLLNYVNKDKFDKIIEWLREYYH